MKIRMESLLYRRVFPPVGPFIPGDLLVSNFNNSMNLQGTGTTIDRIDANNHVTTFFQGSHLGLTTALGVLSRGFVVVGNLPTTDGSSATAKAGSLIILDKNGHQVFQITGSAFVDGPWDMTIDDEGSYANLFVSNAISGTVSRITISVPSSGNSFFVANEVTIASGYTHRGDPAGLEIGPTGLVFDKSTDTLIVAGEGDNKIYSVPFAAIRQNSAGKGSVLYQDNAHLRGPLGMAEAPNGDLIVANSDLINASATENSEYVEFTHSGHFVDQFSIDPSAGGAFGMAIRNNGTSLTFAAVDDAHNTITLWNLAPGGPPAGGIPVPGGSGQIIPQINGRTFNTVSSTGDQNPYGVAFVPSNIAPNGLLHSGNILVSNYNNGMNLQGTGSTIMRINGNGQVSTFFQGASNLGLTTALGVLGRGFVIVGNMPTTDGSSATVKPGSLLIIDKNGHLVDTLTSAKFIDGPWDMATIDDGSTATLFISNVLSGTVSRIVLGVPTSSGNTFHVLSEKQIASGYAHRGDPAALEVGPTGLAFDAADNKLFVAATDDNSIYVIPDAADTLSDNGKGTLVYHDNSHLRGPLGLILLPNGDLITSNSDAINPSATENSEYVEFTQSGQFVDQFSIDPNPGGAFGLASVVVGDEINFAAVNDNQGTLTLWRVHA